MIFLLIYTFENHFFSKNKREKNKKYIKRKKTKKEKKRGKEKVKQNREKKGQKRKAKNFFNKFHHFYILHSLEKKIVLFQHLLKRLLCGSNLPE